MSKEITFQFLWASVIKAMAYGSHRIIPLSIAERAWPATGQNEVLQLALVVGGHPLEPTRVTVEHIQSELSDDPSFVVTQISPSADIHIERRLECCPYCHGSGVAVVDDRGSVPVLELVDSGWAPSAGHRRQKCAHTPATRGPEPDIDLFEPLDGDSRTFA